MKTLGMFFIIWGHLSPEYLKHFIYTFSVPSFFIISGYLFKTCPWKKFLAKNMRSLVVPYFLLGLTVILFFTVVKAYFGTIAWPYFPLSFAALLIGDQNGFGGGIGCQALWFVYTLFIVKALSNYIGNRIYLHISISVCMLALAWFFAASGYSFYSAVANVLLAYPFFAIGYIASLKSCNKIEPVIFPRSRIRILGIVALCGVMVALISRYNGMIEMYNAHFGENVLLFLVGGLIGTYMLACVSYLPDKYDVNGIVRTLSNGSILVLAWQIFFLVGLNLTLFKLQPTLNHNDIVTFILAIGIYGTFVPIIRATNRLCPILIGFRNNK